MKIRYHRSRLFGSLCALAGAAGLVFAGAASAAEPEPGTWESHQTTFNYLGISPVYSCEGLKNGLSYLLMEAGARLDGPITTQSCYNGAGTPSKFASARLKFSALKPAAGGGSEAAAGTVPGTWRKVTISPQTSSFQLHGADCELVEEFKDKILPMLTVRDVQSNLHCVPHQTTGNLFGLSFEAFTPSHAADAKAH
jgi:hypothetical protein